MTMIRHWEKLDDSHIKKIRVSFSNPDEQIEYSSKPILFTGGWAASRGPQHRMKKLSAGPSKDNTS